MNPLLLSLAVLIALLSNTYAQVSAPFEFKDEKGIFLDEVIVNQLLGKNWESYKQYTLNGNSFDE